MITSRGGVGSGISTSNNNGASSSSRGGGGGGGGGMSRAAKKRAKKRAAKTMMSTLSNNGTQQQQHEGTKKSKKMKLPIYDDDDNEEEDDNNYQKLQHVNESSSNKDKKKKKRKKSKKEESLNNNDDKDEINAFAIGDAALVAKEKSTDSKCNSNSTENNNVMETMANDSMAVDDDDDEMGPELESLLSTLTPMQILLLDGDSHDKDTKMPANMATEQSNSHSADDDEEEDGNELATKAEEEGASSLSNIDPLTLINDLTTKHRSKILLSSLLGPSGVTLHEFYDEYWGKKPLLVCLDDEDYDDDEDDAEEDGGSSSVGGKKQHGIKHQPHQQHQQQKEQQQQQMKHSTRLNGFLNRTIIDTMISRNKLRYGLDLNVTRYTDTMGNGLRTRITLDPPPKKRGSKKKNKNKGKVGGEESINENENLEYIVANPTDIWSNVDTSHCTLRLLRPHEHNDNIHTLLSLLESEFGCMVGSNAYLTPLNSQGFAPHYDDVDVFILQLEGYKKWRVYAPLNKRETLPRTSSRDYTEAEIEENGELVINVILGPGDVLYLPRGWIHQAETVSRPSHISNLNGTKDDDHSLHLTVSAMQNWSWADFLELLMPEALEGAASSDKSTSLREGLPRNFLSYMGTMHQVDSEEDGPGGGLPEGLQQAADALMASGGDGEEEEVVDEEAMMKARTTLKTLTLQKHFKEEAKKRIMRVCKQAMSMLDDACDQIGKRFLSDRLPPALLEPERCLTKEALSNDTSAVGIHHHDAAKKIWPNTLCRLVRPNIARLVMEDDKAILYHCLDNSRVYHGTPISPMEFEIDDAPALEQLLTTVEPHWIMVKDLIHGDVEDKMEIAQALFDEGILATVLVDNPDRSVQTG